MRKTMILTAALLAVAPAVQAHPAPAPSRARIVHDVRAVLARAGFRVLHDERGIPGRAPFVRWIERVDYERPAICTAVLAGWYPLHNYLSFALAHLGARDRSSDALWKWRFGSSSVTLWATGSCKPGQQTIRASLIVARYSLPDLADR